MWKKVKISDIGCVITGNTPPRKNPEYYGEHTPFIKPTDISETNKYTYNPEESYSELGYKKYFKSLVPKGSTCVVTIGSIGKKITKAHCDCFINQAMNAVIPFPSFDEDFVYYILKANLEQLKVLDSGTASGRENVSKSSFSNINVLIPEDKSIQRKIASILSAYDDLIENNLKRIKLLEEAARLIYEEWFVRFTINDLRFTIDNETGLPEGWGRKKLKDVADINKNQIKSGFQGQINYVDISSVSPGRINEIVPYDFIEAPGRARRIVKHGDIIWSCVRPNRRSHCIIWNPDDNLIVSTGFAVISPFLLPTSYLYQAVTMSSFVGYLINHTGGAAYPAVTSDIFSEAEILIPPLKIIQDFDGIIRPMINLTSYLLKQNIKLKEARDILLPRLMNGTINVD
jgi:type I restriction enzyme, S subunit